MSDSVFGIERLSALMVPKMLGSAVSREPRWRQAECRGTESLLRNAEGALKPESVSTKHEPVELRPVFASCLSKSPKTGQSGLQNLIQRTLP